MNRMSVMDMPRADQKTKNNGSDCPEEQEVQSNVWLDPQKSEQAVQALKIGSLQATEARIIHSYLNACEFVTARREYTVLFSNIHLAALDGFLAERGYSVEGAVMVTEGRRIGDVSPPAMRIIEVAPGKKEVVPEDGLLFLKGPRGRHSILRVIPNVDTVEITLFTTTACVGAFFDDWEKYAMSHAYLRGKQFYASGEFVAIDPPVRLNDVYMQAETRRLIERTIISFPQQASLSQRRGLAGKRGVILEGPPGTGKTMLCRALCSELDATVIWLTARHVEKDAGIVADAWHLARLLSPTVILLEDLDLFAESREHILCSYSLGELMNQMDGAEDNNGILTVATTNRLDVVENALRNRPGRFDRSIHFGELDETGRERILSKHLAYDRLEDGVLDRLTYETDGYTGARLVDLVKTLIQIAAEEQPERHELDIEITMAAVEQALDELGPVSRKRPVGFAAEHEAVV